MKNVKLVTLAATVLLAGGLLTACGADKKEDTASSSSTTEQSSSTKSSKADAFTGATAGTDNAETLAKGLAANGAWLNALTKDTTSSEDITVDGTFKNEEGKEARELALYLSDPDTHKPTETYTLTVPKLIVNSPNFGIAQGTVKGDVEVNAEGFHMEGTGKVEGNVTFKTQELKDAYDKLPADQKGTITGSVEVAK
ncbi:MAG: hypothetical protein LBM95_05415 [Lactobacillales bacterium]|nr:hypothetical protein [Lactobacillales bacterium]